MGLSISNYIHVLLLVPSEKNALVAWKYCEKKSHSIEIIYRDQENPEEEVLTRVHFDPNIKVHKHPSIQ